MTSKEAYTYLREQFKDAKSTEKWLRAWEREELEPNEFDHCTWRSMSYHASRVLEGYEDQEGLFMTDHLHTEYGPMIYDIICGSHFSDMKPERCPIWPIKLREAK